MKKNSIFIALTCILFLTSNILISQESTTYGHQAGEGNTGARQSAFGYQAGYQNSGQEQSAFGYMAGRSNNSPYQFAFGYQAGYDNTGEYQFAFGYRSGFANSGGYTISLGDNAGRLNTGNNLIAIGRNAGRQNIGQNCVFIGGDAGRNNTLDNQFIVRQVAINPTPLIQGDFSSGVVRFNGPLFVNGKIQTKEIEVTLQGWPDFVFSENYNLLSLNEVEEFINQNKHLPFVPNESEVLQNGIKLGEMSAILLQKIEELTLYLIDLNKQNEELKERISQLEDLF